METENRLRNITSPSIAPYSQMFARSLAWALHGFILNMVLLRLTAPSPIQTLQAVNNPV